MIQKLLDWLRGVKVVQGPVFIDYGTADRLMRREAGWRISGLEDNNHRLGFVWIERTAKKNGGPR